MRSGEKDNAPVAQNCKNKNQAFIFAVHAFIRTFARNYINDHAIRENRTNAQGGEHPHRQQCRRD
jgi:hypothetical protein